MLALSSPVSAIKGVGETTAEKFAALGIETVQDLLFHIPFRYEDYTATVKIGDVSTGMQASITAEVFSITKFRTRRGLEIIKAKLIDDSGAIDAVWFNQPYLLMTLRKGTQKVFSGKIAVDKYSKKLTLQNPSMEEVRDELVHSGRRVPIYPETAELSSRVIRSAVHQAFLEIGVVSDSFSQTFLEQHHLPSLSEALHQLHFPDVETDTAVYKRRLAFGEVYELLERAREKKAALLSMKVPVSLRVTTKQKDDFLRTLPFALTTSQLQAVLDVALDLVQPHPTQRLIQGEVGSGKTVVAAFVLYCAAINNANAFFIAPTQIVAHQHMETLAPIFSALNIPTQLVTAQTPLQSMKAGTVYIGTHALFNQAKKLKPAVVVIDEEHRFGVEQRETFSKNKTRPHLLTMTATPIPRTIAHTVFADSDVSYLEEIPEKTKRVVTKIIRENQREKMYERIKEKIRTDHAQVFIVCPFIQESEKETLSSIKAAEKEFENISKIFSGSRVALLHGKTPKDKRDNTFRNMHNGNIDILVSTPIIEVGVDIPNASIIVIEGAERFGLAQLHQLRGRVGRVGQEAFCLLFTSNGIDETKRLRILETHANGNELAELDLKLRGSGELFGTRQHGWDTLKFASLFDEKLIRECKESLQDRDSQKTVMDRGVFGGFSQSRPFWRT